MTKLEVTNVRSADTFSYKAYLIRHIRTVHDDIKPFKCKICSNRFEYPSALKFHIRAVHDKVKSHQCDHCEMSFSYADVLRKHIQSIHEKVKSYKCEYCKKSFSLNMALKRHVVKIHQVSSKETKKTESKDIKLPKSRKEQESYPTISEKPMIRKRKRIDFSIEDLEADVENGNDSDYSNE